MKRAGIIATVTAGLVMGALGMIQYPAQAADAGRAILLDINGAIGPATRDYVVRGLEDAAEEDAALVILRINTPGGLDASTRDIVQAILNSPVPVATFVAPEGARAASAGAYILLASHVAAMSPATNVGAATPVSITGGPSPAPDRNQENEADSEAEESEKADKQDSDAEKSAPADAMTRKVINDSVAYIRGLAERRGRNADWAEQAVREADSVTAEDALELNVIDLIARNVSDLLSQLDGRTVDLASGEVTLSTEGLVVSKREPDWRNELLAVITDPTIAYILLLVGFYGLVLEGYHPGAIVPGVVGAISLLLALYALQMLPVNYAGLALIVLGIILIIAETLAPSFGALGIGGIIALVIGSIILMDTDVPGFQVSVALVGGIALASSALLLGIVGMAVRARKQPVVAGREHLMGAQGTAAEAFETTGTIHIAGELWTAVSSAPVQSGQSVEVTGIEGLTLHVRPVN